MNAIKLYYDIEQRGVALEADGDILRVDAPAGALTWEDRAALKETKPVLLRFLSRTAEKPTRRSEAHWAGSGWIRILDPHTNEWHEVRASECLPGILAEASSRRVT